MADSNNRRINKLQTVKKIETAEEKSANRTESIRPKFAIYCEIWDANSNSGAWTDCFFDFVDTEQVAKTCFFCLQKSGILSTKAKRKE